MIVILELYVKNNSDMMVIGDDLVIYNMWFVLIN